MSATTLRKWRSIFSIYFQDGLAYRASGIIWIMTDLSTAITMPLVWAKASGDGTIQGFNAGDFVLYYLAFILIGSFVTSHIMWEIAMEIKEGQFSTALVRPISFYQVSFFRNLAWRIIRTALFVPMLLVLLVIYRNYLAEASVFLGWQFWVSLLLGHLVSFTFVMMMAMVALFTEEVMSIFGLYYMPMMFLSGQLFPVSLLPDWARALAQIFPFYYTAGAPTEILIGHIAASEALPVLAIQAVWAIVCYGLSLVFWWRGLRYYTGVGM